MKHRRTPTTPSTRRRRLPLIRIVGGGLFLCGCLFVAVRVLASPTGVIDAGLKQCRSAVSEARAHGASTYAPEQLAAAAAAYEQAMSAWQRQNRRSFLVRDLDSVRIRASQGAALALEAVSRAVAVCDSLKKSAHVNIAIASQSVEDIRDQFGNLAMSTAWRRRLVESELLLSQARAALQRADYLVASRKLDRVIALSSQIDNEASTRIQRYLASKPLWIQWSDETVAWSRSHNDVAVIVDKMARTCRVYSAGRLSCEFAAEFGPNWMSHKLRQGDDATPEGRYRVSARKGAGQTVYYRALAIDYPNERDRTLFRAAQKEGRIPSGARIGGLIEIHGGGGKACDWTNGCVALSNADMERLYRMARAGTPVTIVGTSGKP